MLTAAEFVRGERVPLHRVHRAIFVFCKGRRDVVVFGAQAVNVHVRLPRMSQDVDLLAEDPRAVAEALAAELRKALRIAARVREMKEGVGYRVYQARKDGNRHLADVRLAQVGLGDAVEHGGVRYTSAALTLAMKVCAYAKRRLAPKGATDLADVRRLLLAHPRLRSDRAGVAGAIERAGGGRPALAAWREILAERVVSDEEADEGY